MPICMPTCLPTCIPTCTCIPPTYLHSAHPSQNTPGDIWWAVNVTWSKLRISSCHTHILKLNYGFHRPFSTTPTPESYTPKKAVRGRGLGGLKLQLSNVSWIFVFLWFYRVYPPRLPDISADITACDLFLNYFTVHSFSYYNAIMYHFAMYFRNENAMSYWQTLGLEPKLWYEDTCALIGVNECIIA